MNEEVFNVSIRKFLKTLGVSAQREIEKAVRHALAEGKLKGNERLPAKAVVQALASLFTPDEFFASERTIELRRRRRGRARELNSSLAVGDFLSGSNRAARRLHVRERPC